MEKKNNKKIIIIFSLVVIILIIFIIFLVGKQQASQMTISLFGKDYSSIGLKGNDKQEENKKIANYTDEQLKEEIYPFIERRSDYAVFKNLKGSELAKELNTGSKMVDTSKVSNYEYGKDTQLTINEYIVLYSQGRHHIKIIADSEDDNVIAIRYFCNGYYTNEERDEGMTKIFEKIKSLLNIQEDMDFWKFDNSVDKWQSGTKELYYKGLGIKLESDYEFYIVACPIKDFYYTYSTNL